MSVKDNGILVKYLADMYQGVDLNVIEESLCYVEESKERNKLWEAIEFVRYMDEILRSLPDDYEFILRNDYFRIREKKWYLKYYTKSTYYRLKAEALDAFVRCVTS